MRMAEFGFFSFSLLLGLPPLLPASVLLCSKQVLLGAGWRLKISVGPYRKAVQQHSRTSCTSQPGREEAQKHSVHNKTL
jgi:hypothetical protein